MENKEKKSRKCPICGKFIGQEKMRKYEDLEARALKSEELVVVNRRLEERIVRLAFEREKLAARVQKLESRSLWERIFSK